MISHPVDEQIPKATLANPRLDEAPRSGVGGWLVTILFLAALGVGGYFLVRWVLHRNTQAVTAGRSAAGRVEPVVAATARRGSMNLYLDGLGTVTPLNTVSIKSRVDGQIVKVSYTEGQFVKQGDPLVEIDPRPFQVQLEQAQGQLAKDQASLKNAQLDLERYQSIRQSVTQQQLDTQQATVQQFEGAVKSDQSQVDNANLQITYCHITAPISGRIGLRLVDEGNMVHANDSNALAVIAQLQPISVIFTVPEDKISQVFSRPDHGQGLPVQALSRDLQTTLASGALAAIDNEVDPTTGTVRIKANFDNKDDALFPNEFVNARMLVETKRGVVIVPSAAVQRGPDATFVYLVNPKQTIELRNVTLGQTEGEQTIIESGVSPGDVVVTEGVDKLQPGTKVTVRQAPGHGNRSTTRPATRPAAAGFSAGGAARATTQPAGNAAFPPITLPPAEGRGGRRGRP